MLERGIAAAGLYPEQFSAHGLCSGYLAEATHQSQHQQASPITRVAAQPAR